MSETVVQTLWHITSASYIDTDPELDVMAVTVTGLGREYAVCVSGHKHLNANEIISALRAAAAGMIVACGGDLSVVGCSTTDDAKFDTGNQRAS
jgi:hypothetical protein